MPTTIMDAGPPPVVIGVDPGMDGALVAVCASGDIVEAEPMPTLTIAKGRSGSRRIIDSVRLAGWFLTMRYRAEYPGPSVFVEKAQGMRGQGVASTFNYGYGAGIIEGVLAARGMAHTLVAPAVWTRALGVKGGKDGARHRAGQISPESAHAWTPARGRLTEAQARGVVDAFLIARYGLTVLAQESG